MSVATPLFLAIRNGASAPFARVPCLAEGSFREAILALPQARLVALFGFPDEEAVRLLAVLARAGEHELSLTSTLVDRAYRALTPERPEAHLFEREIAEQWGVVPEGHPWLKPVRFHHSYRPGRDAWGRSANEPILPGVMPYFQVAGDEVHEVAVGPVHAGVIEPGHFRFQCHGERILHLEISLGYQHRGIEHALLGGPAPRTAHVIDAVAGDSSVGHALAHAQLVEALAGVEATPRGHALRAVALELERLANHAGDLGTLAGDIGYLPAASYCGRIRGDLLNLTLLACGNRMGLGWVRPGGAAMDLDPDDAARMAEALERAIGELERSFNLIRDNPTVRARLEETGPLSRETCEALGLVGPAARASGVSRDVRRDHPAGAYASAPIPTAEWSTTDVFARARVRWLECSNSAAYAGGILRSLPEGPARAEVPALLRPDQVAVSLAEGWRGEICHVAITDDRGRFRRYKIIDPSFHNWAGLAMAMRDQAISDFPLCNKSFNLSYSGHDL